MTAPRSLHPLAKAALGASVALAFLAAVEGVLALLDVPDPGLFEGDPAELWFLRPNLDREVPYPAEHSRFHVTTNDLGLRGPPPPPSGPWTLVLGCSTTFGWGVDDDETFPADLAKALGTPVVNGGVPGWTTEQAIRGARRWLDLHPTRVILAYIVRDAWPARIPDAEVPPTPFPYRTHLGRLLLGLRPSLTQDRIPTDAQTYRVPVHRYEANLRTLETYSGNAEVVLLAFPQLHPASDWIAAMRRVGRTLTPTLQRTDFFEHDPVHLTPLGNHHLATVVATSLRSAEN